MLYMIYSGVIYSSIKRVALELGDSFVGRKKEKGIEDCSFMIFFGSFEWETNKNL